MTNWSKIRELVDLFMEGGTTLNEEQQLYAAFREGNIPADLQELAPMFAGFNAMAFPEKQETEPGVGAPGQGKRLYAIGRIVLSIAATVIIAFIIGWVHNGRTDERMATVYDESFVIENGQKQSYSKDIEDDISQVLAEARQIEKEALETTRAEEALLDGISNASEREHIRKLLE